MTSRTLAIIAAALSSLLTSAAAQQPEKTEQQTEIESVRLRVQNDGENAYFHFSESVVLTATNMILNCDSLEVFATRQAESDGEIGKLGAIREIVATGNVRIVQAERTATCDKAVVQPNEERIVLTGNPTVEQPGGRITGDEINLDRRNGQIRVHASPGRVIRLTGPSIRDLGFEQDQPVPLPEPIELGPISEGVPPEGEAPAEGETEGDAQETPQSDADSADEESPDAP